MLMTDSCGECYWRDKWGRCLKRHKDVSAFDAACDEFMRITFSYGTTTATVPKGWTVRTVAK